MAKALVHFINSGSTPLPIVIPDQVTKDDMILRTYLRTNVIDTIGKKNAIRCIWFLADVDELRAYYPTAQSVECRTYNTDELILASIDPAYSALRDTGRTLQLLEDNNVEPITPRINQTELQLVSSTE